MLQTGRFVPLPKHTLGAYEILYRGLLRAVLGLWKVKIQPSAGAVSVK